MNDKLNTELKRFADLCAKVRPDWNVQIGHPSPDGDYPSVTVEGVDVYDTYSRSDCAAMINWLLDEFPEVDLRIHLFNVATGQRIVHANNRATRTAQANHLPHGLTSDDAPLHHVVLHQVLLAVNMVLEHEVWQKTMEADSTP